VVVLGAVLATLAGCQGGARQESPPPRPVHWAAARPAPAALERALSGVVRASASAQLAFEVPGRIDSVRVDVGDSVVAGEVLATLDAGDFRLQAGEATAAVTAARARQQNAARRHRRLQALWEHGNVAAQELDAAAAAHEAATARLEAARQRRDLARRKLRDTRLRAPYRGLVAAVPAEVGQVTAAGRPAVLLSAAGGREVAVAVPGRLISRVRPRMPVRVTFTALPDDTAAGRVVEVGVAPAGFATTYPVTVRLPRPPAAVRPGMAATVHFAFDAPQPEAVTVPATAVVEDRAGRHVYVLDTAAEDSLASVRRRDVTVGRLLGDRLEILAGLAPRERVVTAGAGRLREGQRVRLGAGPRP
jgi:RND family efflux transporter MFP subunit